VASLPLPADEVYRNIASPHLHNSAAYNLSGCRDHNVSIARWIDAMAELRIPTPQIEKILKDLTSRNTYGAFSELSAYGFLLDANIPFQSQVPMNGNSVLNCNGSDLDGVMDLGSPVFFDVKAFGLNEYLVQELKAKLSFNFPSSFVAIGGSSDLGVNDLNILLGKGLQELVSDLAKNCRTNRGALEISIEPKRQVQCAISSADPYALAENHADYVFRFAKQFVRQHPFILVFVIHPWLGGNRLHSNFAGDTTVFTRSFARRSFMQYSFDNNTKVMGVTRAIASKLLSGILFVNSWPKPLNGKHRGWLYLNPYAANPISQMSRNMLLENTANVYFDNFEHDAY